jgi:hypothetical protein
MSLSFLFWDRIWGRPVISTNWFAQIEDLVAAAIQDRPAAASVATS